MDRMRGLDAGFYLAEGEKTPLHVGSVAIFDGPAPAYDDVVRLVAGALPRVPRYRQRVERLPFDLGRPVWVDDPHFRIDYHVRHTALPRPGGDDELRALAGRVLGHRLDLARPLWELWLVEGLADDRWAIVNKVHHAVVDGVAGTDLMQLFFDIDPDASHPDPVPWEPRLVPATFVLALRSVTGAVTEPVRKAVAFGRALAVPPSPRSLRQRAAVLGGEAITLGRQVLHPGASALNGPVSPHRRWAWLRTPADDVRRIREAFGGSLNDVVLAAVAGGFRDLLTVRGTLTRCPVVRVLVPVSTRRPAGHGALDNQLSMVFVDLPVGEPAPAARLASVRAQMNSRKRLLAAFEPRTFMTAVDLLPTPLVAAAASAVVRIRQPWVHAVTTDVPGPPVPLYVLGRRMRCLYPYVPIGCGFRISIGVFSYDGTVSFGVSADYDGVPDVERLAAGIRRGLDELLAATEHPASSVAVLDPEAAGA